VQSRKFVESVHTKNIIIYHDTYPYLCGALPFVMAPHANSRNSAERNKTRATAQICPLRACSIITTHNCTPYLDGALAFCDVRSLMQLILPSVNLTERKMIAMMKIVVIVVIGRVSIGMLWQRVSCEDVTGCHRGGKVLWWYQRAAIELITLAIITLA
jgi:hypothetical protein